MFAVLVLLVTALLAGCSSSTENMPVATGAVLSAGTPTVGINTCAGCHQQQAADWMTTKHANAEGGLYSQGNPTLGQMAANCIACHDPLGDSANVVLLSSLGAVPRPVVGCESCHGPGSIHVNKGGMGAISLLSGTYTDTVVGSVPVSGQFAMCTSCHELLNTAGTGTNQNPAHATIPPTGSNYVITDTHFAVGGDYSGANGGNILTITGYSMDFNSATVCTDCHNPHKTADVNNEWALSAHADKTGAPWSHYNWSCDTANCGAFGDRTSCQRCHTATGFAGYADALGAGNRALASAIWNGTSPQLSYNASFKPEMLLCKGCHFDNRGHLRNPGAYQATYKIPVGGFPSILPVVADVSYQYPDAGASNVCIPCHSARGSGRAIHAVSTAQSFTNFSFPDGHYLSAGGTMFKGTAYEYGGRSYTDPLSFKHKLIGTSAAPKTGAHGPCIGCHMERPGLPGNHRFEPISRDASGAIVNVSSEICFQCHAGSASGLAEVVEMERENYEYALQAFEQQLLVSDPSYSFTTAYPYFTNTNHLSTGDSDATGNTTGKNNVGAAFNFSLLHHEPGGYIHNSRYVKRIIYDSIDWLDNHQMDYSVGRTLQSGPLTDPAKTAAMNYLLNQASYDQGGTIIPSPAERP